MTPHTLYYRKDEAHNRSIIKAEVYNGRHCLTGREMRYAYENPAQSKAGNLIYLTVGALRTFGAPEESIKIFLDAKQCSIPGTALPFDKFKQLGWELKFYPFKYLRGGDTYKVFITVKLAGLNIDVSNLVLQECFADTRGGVLKDAVELFDEYGIRVFLYVDHSLPGQLLKRGWNTAYDYLMSFFDAPVGYRRIVISPRGKTADELMLKWADRNGNSILSCDSLGDFEAQYPWILHGAEEGHPRLHKFFREGNYLTIPDLGLETELVTKW